MNEVLVNGKYWRSNAKIAETMGLNPRDYLTLSIKRMNLSTRAYNCLNRVGIESMGDLINRSPNDLMKLRQLGGHSLDIILNECERVLSKCSKSEIETDKHMRGGHSEKILEKLNLVVSHVISDMKSTADLEFQEEVMERILFDLSDEDLWRNSSLSYSQAVNLLVQSKTDLFYWNGIVADEIKELSLLTVVCAFFVSTGEMLDVDAVESDETVGNIDVKKFMDYYDGENWRRLYRWICVPLSEVEKEIYFNSMEEWEKKIISKKADGISNNRICREMGITSQKLVWVVENGIKKILYEVRVTGFIGYMYAIAGKKIITLDDLCKVIDSEVAKVILYAFKNVKNEALIPTDRYYYSELSDAILIQEIL